MAELDHFDKLALKYGRYMKISFIISLILFTLAGFWMLEDAFANQPTNPVLSVGTITDTTIDLTWTETATNHQHDVIRCEGVGCTPITVVGNNLGSPSFQDSGLTQTTTYRYQVDERHGGNSALSNIVEATTLIDTGGQGPPKVELSAVKQGNGILLTWNNPLSTPNGIPYRYSILKEVNLDSNEFQIFDTQRNLQEKTVNLEGEETYFFLDEDITGGNSYTYRIQTGIGQGQGNPVFSDTSETVLINPQVIRVKAEATGYLIVGRTISPIIPITWFNWFEPQLANADGLTTPIFVTGVNPQSESYRLALEPVPKPDSSGNCNQILEVEYRKNAEMGQNFQVVATIFETEFITDDETGSEVTVEVIIPRYQTTFIDFSPTTKLKQKWFSISPENQTINDYSQLEVQFDITGNFEINPLEHRSLSFLEVLFEVPLGNNAC